jgi:hypothetical protein
LLLHAWRVRFTDSFKELGRLELLKLFGRLLQQNGGGSPPGNKSKKHTGEFNMKDGIYWTGVTVTFLLGAYLVIGLFLLK